jgi:hypothetical protein
MIFGSKKAISCRSGDGLLLFAVITAFFDGRASSSKTETQGGLTLIIGCRIIVFTVP